jgi:hypothetical protein
MSREELLALADELERLHNIADATPDGQPDGYSETQAAFDQHVDDNLSLILVALRKSAPAEQEPVAWREALEAAKEALLSSAPSGPEKTVCADDVIYHLSGQKCGWALNKVRAALATPPRSDAESARAAVIEECAKVLDEAAQDWNRIRDPGMANNARSYAKKIRALASEGRK